MAPQFWIKDEDLIPLLGKVVVITGGSSGMGLATTKLLLSLGALVVSGDMNDSPISHPNHTFVQTNVTIWSDLKNLFKTAQAKHSRIDHVFSNAGVGGKVNYLVDTFDETGELLEPETLVYDINLRGMINTSYLGLHYMRTQSPPGGSIVCTASASSFQRFAVWDYTTAKHGVLGWMRGAIPNLIDQKLPIRVNCIGPAWTITGLVPQHMCDAAGIESQPADVPARNVALLMADERRQGEFHFSSGGRYYEIEDSHLLPAAREAVGVGKLDEQAVFERLKELKEMLEERDLQVKEKAAAVAM